ncbi:MAG TPA: M28 family peptidase [Puia sp.]|nr:M28 family peptidase [Puia sp.]
MTVIFRPSSWLFLLILFVCWFVIRLDFAPAPVNEHPADTNFHVNNVVSHLRQMARVPHSMGTAANDSVRAYIVAACRNLGLDVEERPFTVVDQWYGDALAARGINIAATLHGASRPQHPSDSSRTILVMAHYDSEPNALGAGDDGSACASMLETARALRAGAPLPCDVLFLFTNGEEEGLLGAEAFSLDSAQTRNIGLILNFDGRGDAGKCLMFRTSASNREIIDEFARAPIHHAGASLYSELFKLLPNNTDFSPFEKTRIPGMDFAFAEGFVHYHNLTDNVENLDRRTIQDEGDNMLGTIRHFAQIDLYNLSLSSTSAHSATQSSTPSGNAGESTTFFNLLANLFIHYSPSLNFILLIVTNALVLLALVSGLYRRQVYPRQAASGLLLFAATLAILYFLSGWTLDAIRAAWPLYLGYYPNAYNAYYFYLALAAEALGVFTVLYQWPIRKWSMPSLFIAVLVFQTIVLDLIFRYIPAGVYFLYFPLIGSALLFPFLSRETPSGRATGRSPSAVSPSTSAFPRQSAFSLFAGALLPILFLAPLVYSLAELFDVQPEAAMVAPVTGLLLGLLVPVLSRSLRESRWFIPSTALVVLLVAAGLGVLHGSYDPQRPLKTDLRYFARVDDHRAWWVSHSTKPDRWNKTFFANASLQPNAYQYAHPFPGINRELFNQAPYLDLPAPSLAIAKDSIAEGHRLLYLHCQPVKGTTTIHMSFSHDLPADGLTFPASHNAALPTDHDATFPVNHLSGTFDRADFIAPPDDGFDMIISCKPGKPFSIDLTARTMGLPAGSGFRAYAADIIPTAASWANTTLVQRSYTFP